MGKKVFLSHNSDDKPSVEKLAEVGFEPWLDKWNLTPGRSLAGAVGSGFKGEGKICCLKL